MLFHWIKNFIQKEEQEQRTEQPFVVSEYLDRIEKANLEIMEERKPVEKVIILWWGLDGLRLNEDGSIEWISRKEPETASQNVFWQPCQTITPLPQFNTFQSTQATIDALMAPKTDLTLVMASGMLYADDELVEIVQGLSAVAQGINIHEMQMQARIQTCQMSYPGYYPAYLYSGISGYAHPTYLQQIQSCCCEGVMHRNGN